jgi:hypothetical protein
LLNRLGGAESALTAAIAELRRAGNSPLLAQSEANLSALARLQATVSDASPAALAALTAEIVAMTTTAMDSAQQARGVAASSQSGDAGSLATLASASREQVQSVMRGMQDFDPYLQFDSAKEEAAYREREVQRRAYIEAQQAKGTPEGDLNAAGAAVGQMTDAKAHGAGDSPQFQKRWDDLVESTQKLRNQLIREGRDVSQFDESLRDDLRQIMKSKGLTDAQIEARLAAHPDNPLEAVKDYANDRDIRAIETPGKGQTEKARPPAVALETDAPQASMGNMADAMGSAVADLKALGVVAAEHEAGAEPSHGVTANVATPAGRATALS